jgi:glucose-6-phosphate 1-dehydrogenase
MSMSHKSPPPPCAIVIFGANGDLTKRLIIPALYNLARTGLLPKHLSLVGVDHNKKTSEEWTTQLKEFLGTVLAKNSEEIDDTLWRQVAHCMTFLSGDFEKPETYSKLKDLLAELDEKQGLGGNVLFYMAVADRFFPVIAGKLGEAGLVDSSAKGFRRLIVEKPFGHDLASAKSLNACLLKWLKEDQIYRIDHFLGKETVQNIMALRFANGLFEPIWNRDRIDHVQITVAESIGIEGRGNFYEKTGALRDMVPNHLFQLVAMTAMEPPVSFDAEDIRAKKAELFKAMQTLTLADVVRGQYDAGVQGEPVPAYRREPNVAPDSNIETYVAMRLKIDNWRWAGVPFYLRTGKRLNIRSSEIAIRFKQAPYALFRDTPVDELDADWLIMRIQPDEGIRLRFNAKRPGPAMTLESVSMRFNYKDYFHQAPAVGYETLIYDCLIGDATLFQRADQVEAAWALVEPVLEGWQSTNPRHFPNYAAGSEGPIAANDLLAKDGRSWRAIRILGGK